MQTHLRDSVRRFDGDQVRYVQEILPSLPPEPEAQSHRGGGESHLRVTSPSETVLD